MATNSPLASAITDFIVLSLLVGAAGFGGYYYGIHERFAPVKTVAPGTPGAISPLPLMTPSPIAKVVNIVSPSKYWLSSSGADYVGYSITVTVNGYPVDNFFAPGKQVDITRLLHRGQNELTFKSKQLGARFNLHKGDKNSTLKIAVVKGKSMQEAFKTDDILVSCERSANESEDITDKRLVAID